jgi:hypothetical protein
MAGAALLTVAVAGASSALGGDQPNPNGAAAGPDPAAVSSLFPAGSELQFVAVAPCRIIDTRKAGGQLSATSRVFDATLATYAAQGGLAGSCNISAAATAVQLNLGAISTNGKSTYLAGWATGTVQPTASLLNTNPAAPTANMVTVPVNAIGQFTLKTPGAMHVFADVAGFYVKPLYATVQADGTVWSGMSSGLVSSVRDSTGTYTLTFNRDVEMCAATTSDWAFFFVHEISADVRFGVGTNTVTVVSRNASGALEDTMFNVSLTC